MSRALSLSLCLVPWPPPRFLWACHALRCMLQTRPAVHVADTSILCVPSSTQPRVGTCLSWCSECMIPLRDLSSHTPPRPITSCPCHCNAFASAPPTVKSEIVFLPKWRQWVLVVVVGMRMGLMLCCAILTCKCAHDMRVCPCHSRVPLSLIYLGVTWDMTWDMTSLGMAGVGTCHVCVIGMS